MRPDPFPRIDCGRETCPLTFGDQVCREKCYQCNVNYSIFCAPCRTKARDPGAGSVEPVRVDQGGGASQPEHQAEFIYIGESSRGCYQRFSGHIQDSAWMNDHMIEHHEFQKGNIPAVEKRKMFGMEIHKVDKDVFRRVLREAVRIRRTKHREEERLGEFWRDRRLQRGQEPDRIQTAEGGRGQDLGPRIMLMNGKDEWNLPALSMFASSQLI